MKLKDLKKMLDKMSKEQLDQDLIVIACERTQSGYGEARKAKAALYYNGEDDPSSLYTMSELKDMYEPDEIAGMEVVVKRGEFYIELP